MAIAQGAQHGISYVKEVTFGTTPGSPSMKTLRNNGTGLNPEKDSITSEEIRSDRMITDVRHGNRRPRGDIPFELSYGAQVDFIEAALQGTWATNVVKGGVTAQSFTIERRFTDIAQYIRYLGAMVDTMTLELRPGRMVTGSFGIIAADFNVAGTTLGAPAAAPTASPFDTFTGTLTEGGVTIAYVTGLTLNLNNNLDPAFVLFSNKARQINSGRSNLTGRLQAWFEDASLLNKFLNEVESSLSVTLDGTGGDLTILVPRLKYNSGGITMQGEQGIQVDIGFQALRDNTTASNIQITRAP
jgi:hypothetical protein